MIANLDRRPPDNARVGAELDSDLSTQFLRQDLLEMFAIIRLHLDRSPDKDMDDSGGLIGEPLEFLADAMDLASPVMLDQQAEQVFGSGAELRLEQLGQLHPSADAHGRVVERSNQNVVLKEFVEFGKLLAPGVDRILFLGQLENTDSVAARHAARFRHEPPPPRWCARSAPDASSHPGSRR